MKKILLGIMLLMAFVILGNKSMKVFAEEGNETLLTADEISFDTDYSKALDSNKDKDWYKFTVSQEMGFTLYVTSYVPDSGLDVELYSEEGDRIDRGSSYYFSEDIGFKKNEEYYWLRKGTYYLKFSSSTTLIGVIESAAGKYEFKLHPYTNTAGNIAEPNDNFLTAYSIGLGAQYQGIVDYFDNYDICKFVADESGTYNISYNILLYGHLYLFDDNGNKVSSFKSVTADGEKNLSGSQSIWLKAGTYYIEVSPVRRAGIDGGGHYMGGYQLKVDKQVAELKESSQVVKQTPNTVSFLFAISGNCKIKKKKTKVISFGVVYTGKAEYPKACKVKFTKKGIVKKVSMSRKLGKVSVKVKAKKKGTTYMYIQCGDKISNKVKIKVK